MRRSPQAGSLVVALGRATSSELEALARLRRSFGGVVAVVTEGREETSVRGQAVTVVDARADGTFAPSWGSMVARIEAMHR